MLYKYTVLWDPFPGTQQLPEQHRAPTPSPAPRRQKPQPLLLCLFQPPRRFKTRIAVMGINDISSIQLPLP